MIAGARVVALGENSHFIEEFALLRRRVLRFLVERRDFTALAFEYGFSEGFTLDAWARGEGHADDLAHHLDGAIPVGLAEPLHWLREHNRTAARPVRFAGIDIPGAGGSGAVAAPAWARLGTVDQNTLTAILARLLIRFRAVEPLYVSRSDQDQYDVALRRLEGACHADHTFRAMAGLFAGGGLTADTSARDVYMAGSVRWHLERLGPGSRIVLAAHNAHIQTEPISFDGHLTTLPMGQHPRRALGGEYFALGLTSLAGDTAEMRRDEDAPFGFTVENAPLAAPEPGSVEAAFASAGHDFALADLRRTPRPGPDRVRMHGSYLHTSVADAYDGILTAPRSTVSAGV